MNGLMLTPDADLLFDRGFITFHDDGEVEISPRVDTADLRRLGLGDLAWKHLGLSEAPASWNKKTFAPEQRKYLEYHRSEVFVQLVN